MASRKPIKSRIKTVPSHKHFSELMMEEYDAGLKNQALDRTRARKAARIYRETEKVKKMT
jgi:hypothetical protein